MKPVAVVTGATGYLGQALSDELADRQWTVRRCTRRCVTCENDTGWMRDDPANRAINPELFENVDTVFHVAGLAHQRSSIAPKAYANANVKYSESVATRARQAGVRHFVYVSSVAAVADHTTDAAITPASEPAPRTAYGKSKLAAEQAIRRILDPASTTWTIVRPPLIYGPNPKGNLKPLLWLSRLPVPLPFRAIDNKRSMVSLGNLIDLLAHCANKNFPGTNRVLMPADVCLSTPALVSALRAANGSAARLFSVPDPVYDWLTALPGVGPRAQVLRSSLWVDDPWLHQSLRWQARFSAQEQISEMATTL